MFCMTKKLSDQVRRIVEQSDLSQYRIAQTTGIDESNLSRFVRGKHGISMDSLDILAGVVGFMVVKTPTPEPAPAPAPKAKAKRKSKAKPKPKRKNR
jgi:predicted XRE-type DNA-binding protein